MYKLIALLITVGSLFGCATPATQQAMIINKSDVNITENQKTKLKGSIEVVSVTGGKETNPLWTSQVDSKTFKGALEDSLTIVGYRSQDKNPKFKIDANLLELDQPLFGLTFSVKSNVNYTISYENKSQIIPISATGQATPSDAFIAIERLKIANERAISENIKAFILKFTEIFGN
jgi:hypothetical protein